MNYINSTFDVDKKLRKYILEVDNDQKEEVGGK